MKKMFYLLLALVMMMSMTVTAFAETVGQNGTSSADVKATYSEGADGGKIYSVDIVWQGMNFTYTAADTKWNPETHSYEPVSEPYWSEGSISVTNHSNASITATPSYTAETGFEGISMIFDNETLEVGTADNGLEGAAGSPVTETIIVNPDGNLNKGVVDTKIGTITITIS